MDAIVQFFEMGGYALYVWGAYGMTFALVGIEIAWLVWRSRRSRHQRVRGTEQRRPVRPQWRRQP